jgi:hypothetical protein
MTRYQFIYGAIAYGAYRERKANTHRFEAQHYWQIWFLFFSIPLVASVFILSFIFLGTL